MLLQEFCQDVIFKCIPIDGITRIQFYKFRLHYFGDLSNLYPELTQKKLTDEANFINKAIYSLAIGSFDTSELAKLEETIIRVIGYLKPFQHNASTNYIESSVPGYPDQTLHYLEEMLKKVVAFKNTNKTLESLTTPGNRVRLELFQEITKATIQNRFAATADKCVGLYDYFIAFRRAAHGYKNACKYIQTGDMAALEAFLEYEKQDSKFFMKNEVTRALKTEVARDKLIKYASRLTSEIQSSFAINKERKEAKLKKITDLIKSVEEKTDVAQKIAEFKSDPEATAGFQIGFFNIRKSRAAEVVDCLEQAFQNC